jgi:DNA polymerase-4
MVRTILHVDMDEFFAAVEKLDNPQLRGKCLLIGGDARKRGVVATASYEARVFGCHSAMPMAKAVRLCPHAIVLAPRGRRYREISGQVFEIFERFTPLIEPLSCDEAFLDLTGCERLLGDGPAAARAIKNAIRSEIGLTASVGVGPNKFLAKLASDLEKPDGLSVLTPENLRATLDPLPVGRIWGLGPTAADKLARVGVRTIGQLLAASGDMLRRRLGSAADHYLALARGEDDRQVIPDSRAKSLGQEQTFAQDIGSADELRGVLLEQVEHVARRLRRHKLQARSVHLKLRYGDFTTVSRSATLDEPTDLTALLWQRAAMLFDKWARTSLTPLRLLGFSVSELSGQAGRQLELFAPPASDQRHGRVDQAIDTIADRFGPGAIGKGLGLGKAKHRE